VTGNKSIVFKFADVEVREREFRLVKAGEVLPVEPKTFRVLLYLLRNPQKLIAKEELLNAVWGDAAVTDSSLTRTIAQLRRLLGDEIRNPRYIETVATVGYRFLFPVEISEDVPGRPGTTDKANGLSEADIVQPPPIVQIEETVTNPLKQADTAATDKGQNEKQTDGLRSRRWKWLLSGVALLALSLAVATWYLRRPLPPLRIAENGYTQITHDGRGKQLAGTDGSRLYFTGGSGMGPIAQVAISGGDIAPIPTALPVFSLQDVSPDGSSLLVTTFDGSGHWGLWTVPIPAGSSRQLLTGVSVNSAAWSPDGKSVVYTTGNSDIDVIQSDGTGLRRVADVGGPSSTLSWSPDGSRIRFFKESRLWEMASDGSGLHALLPGWLPTTPLCCGRWTADGKFFVFLLQHPVRSGYQPGNQLWALDARRGLFRRPSTEPLQLTSGPVRWNTPIPSKDGTKIFAQGVILRGELVRFDAQSRQLQPWLGGISAEYVAFSPDGQFLTYVTFPGGVLWRANRDGSNALQLTNPPTYPVAPHWSPDGAQILFFQEDSLGRLRSYIVSSQGGTPRQLVPEEKGGTGDASWSPDGRKIVFSSVESMEAISSSNYDLRILDLGSHQVTTLSGSHGTFSPRWSPNGRFIAGLHIGAPGGLKVFDLETQRSSVLPEKGEVDWPTWSSNSQFIYFLRLRDNPGVFRVRISDGVEERVVDLKGFRSTGAFTAWFGLDPNDAPLLIRDVGTADIYALTLEQK
jgi:Tol biopolymer transport system component/DNA-binding winged helix-turn-helix (wHTH) protein